MQNEIPDTLLTGSGENHDPVQHIESVRGMMVSDHVPSPVPCGTRYIRNGPGPWRPHREHLRHMEPPARTRCTGTMNRSLRRCLALISIALVVAPLVACDDGGDDGAALPPTPVASTPIAEATPVPGEDERATLTGTLTLDDVPLDAEFLGVRVVRDGLVAACQHGIPPVTGGAYEIGVVADAEVRGCGADGAQMMLWAFVDGRFVFSQETAPWPGAGGAAKFDATFSSADTLGAGTPVTELKGLLYGPNVVPLPGGTVVEAYIGETLCGITSLRYADATEGYYTLLVVGPESIAACVDGGAISFRLDGKPAAETAANNLNRSSEAEREVNLTLR